MSKSDWRWCEREWAQGRIAVKRLSDSNANLKYFTLRIGEEVAKRNSVGRLSMGYRGKVKEGYCAVDVIPQPVVWYEVSRSGKEPFKAGQEELGKVGEKAMR